jgi:type III secretory pathway component EscU
VIYLPILLIIIGIPALLLLIALEDLYWYQQWSRKKMIKQYHKDIARNKKEFK